MSSLLGEVVNKIKVHKQAGATLSESDLINLTFTLVGSREGMLPNISTEKNIKFFEEIAKMFPNDIGTTHFINPEGNTPGILIYNKKKNNFVINKIKSKTPWNFEDVGKGLGFLCPTNIIKIAKNDRWALDIWITNNRGKKINFYNEVCEKPFIKDKVEEKVKIFNNSANLVGGKVEYRISYMPNAKTLIKLLENDEYNKLLSDDYFDTLMNTISQSMDKLAYPIWNYQLEGKTKEWAKQKIIELKPLILYLLINDLVINEKGNWYTNLDPDKYDEHFDLISDKLIKIYKIK